MMQQHTQYAQWAVCLTPQKFACPPHYYELSGFKTEVFVVPPRSS